LDRWQSREEGMAAKLACTKEELTEGGGEKEWGFWLHEWIPPLAAEFGLGRVGVA